MYRPEMLDAIRWQNTSIYLWKLKEVNATSDLTYGVMVALATINLKGTICTSTVSIFALFTSLFLRETFHEYTVGLFYDRIRHTCALFYSHSWDSNVLTPANDEEILISSQTLDALLFHHTNVNAQKQLEISWKVSIISAAFQHVMLKRLLSTWMIFAIF